MTLSEAKRRFTLKRHSLEEYAALGFIRKTGAFTEDGEEDYRNEDFEQLGLAEVLLRAGFPTEEAKRYLKLTEEAGADEEQIRMLRKQRRILLDGIHERQKLLDMLDHMIWEKNSRKIGGL